MNKRRLLDINNLKILVNHENINVTNNVIRIRLKGPKDTIYSSGSWIIRIELTSEYPYKSPSVGFETKIYHPNVDFNSGSICLNVLNQTWTPIYNLSHIYETFIPQLLLYPNAKDPLNADAARLYLENRDEFDKHVKLNIKKYCLSVTI
jgi:ubiquitin-conjugating enzyme E2 H